MNFASRWMIGGAVLLAGSVSPMLAGSTSASTNRVDYTEVSGTNDVRHVPRWYEEPVKDPLTLLQEMQANAQADLGEAPVFTMEDGLYSLIAQREHVAAAPLASPDKMAAWDATPARKETPLEFSAVEPRHYTSFATNGATAPLGAELTKAPSPQTGNSIQFHSANEDNTLETPGKTRRTEDEGLPGPPPNVPLQPEP